MSQVPWPKKKVERFLSMVLLEPGSNCFINADEMAKEFKLTEGTVHQRVARYRKEGLLPKYNCLNQIDISRRAYTLEERCLIQNLYTAGYDRFTIATRLGRTPTAIQNQIVHLIHSGHMKPHNPTWTSQQELELIEHAKYDSSNSITNLHELSHICGHTYNATRTQSMRLRKRGYLPEVTGPNDRWMSDQRDQNKMIFKRG